jgi:predicted NAD/FAD-binding protein
VQVNDRPQWYTVRGGSREYVRRMLARIADARLATPVRAVRRMPPASGTAGVRVATDQGEERFDDVVLATHTDQSLALLADAPADERRWLASLRYQRNRTVLHTDTSVMPRRPLAWAAWNYERAPSAGQEHAGVCLHYWINRLQPLPWKTPVVVSLNPTRPIDPARVVAEFDVDHPVFDLAAIGAQRELPRFQGRSHVWFCGAWTRYGFHEDGLMSGLAVVQGLREQWKLRDDAARAA